MDSPSRCRCRRFPARGRSAPAPARARPAGCPAVVFDLEERPRSFRIAGADRHAPALRRVLERVVDRLASASRSSSASPDTCTSARSKPEVDFLLHRAVHPFVGRVLDHRAQVHAGTARPRDVPPGSARASASSWLARRAVRIVARCTCSSCARVRLGHALRQRESRCAPAGRRAACAAGARRWRGSAAGCRWTPPPAGTAGSARPTSGRASSGACAGSMGRRSRAERERISADRSASGARPRCDAEPDDRERRQRDQQFRHQAREHDVARELAALVGRLRDLHRADPAAAGHLQRDDADLPAAIFAVVGDHAVLGVLRGGDRRQAGIAGERGAVRAPHM